MGVSDQADEPGPAKEYAPSGARPRDFRCACPVSQPGTGTLPDPPAPVEELRRIFVAVGTNGNGDAPPSRDRFSLLAGSARISNCKTSLGARWCARAKWSDHQHSGGRL